MLPIWPPSPFGKKFDALWANPKIMICRSTREVTIRSLSPESRLWLFVSAKPISLHTYYIQAALDNFVPNWQSHGTPVKAAWDTVDDHIIRVAADVVDGGISGCSSDGLIHTMQEIEARTGLALFDRLQTPVRFESGRMAFAPYNQARQGEGVAAGAKYWLDTTITRLREWGQAWQQI